MKTKLFAFIALMLLPLGMAAQSDSVEARLKAKPGVTLETILGKSLLTEQDMKLLDYPEDYAGMSDAMKILRLNVLSSEYDGKDDARAFRFMHEAARLGDCWSIYEMGLNYILGKGTNRDIPVAKMFLQKAASMDGYGSKSAKDILKEFNK